MRTYDVEVVELPAQPAAVVHGHVAVADIPQFLGDAFGAVIAALGRQGLQPAGPPFSRYVPRADGFDVDAGFPVPVPAAQDGRVVGFVLPGGPAVRVLHEGDYATLGRAYDAVRGWAEDHGLVPIGPPWESYLDGPEVPEPRTVVCLPCARPGGNGNGHAVDVSGR
jgi:effector-binding domain-containing protein